MKRLGIIAAIIVLTALFETAVCFAGSLEIVNSYPHDGGKGLQPVNCAVKLYFNQDVSSAKYLKSNADCFKITDSANKSQPITVLHDSKDTNMVLVVLNENLQQDSEYKLSVSGDFTASSGDTLLKDQTITFRTRNQKTDTNISMVMMAVMFVGILFFSSRQMKRQAQKAAGDKDKEEKVNPYKVSKETGKSVADVVRKTEKQKKKKAEEEAKRKPKEAPSAKAAAESEDTGDAGGENGNKRVKGPRPISAAGSAYRSGKKAKAEAEAKRKAAERAAGTTRPKNQTGKAKKNKKK